MVVEIILHQTPQRASVHDYGKIDQHWEEVRSQGYWLISKKMVGCFYQFNDEKLMIRHERIVENISENILNPNSST